MDLPQLELCGPSESVLGWSLLRNAWEIVDFNRFIAFQRTYVAWQYLPAPPIEDLKAEYTLDELAQCLALAEHCWGNNGDPAALDAFLAEYDCRAQDALVQRIKEKFN